MFDATRTGHAIWRLKMPSDTGAVSIKRAVDKAEFVVIFGGLWLLVVLFGILIAPRETIKEVRRQIAE